MESLRRGLGVLECFSSAEPELRLTEICEKTGLAPSTAHRIVHSLVHAGYLLRSESSKTYSIGLRAYTVGTLYLRYADPLLEATTPVLDLLSQLTHERIALHVRDGQWSVLIASRECPHPVRYTEPIGCRAPLHCGATGKAMLSDFDSAALAALYPDERLERFTDVTITSRTALLAQLAETRRTGVAYNDGENFSDMRGVAAPIRNAQGVIVAGLSVAGPSFRIDDASRNRLGALVRKASLLASKRLGCVVAGGDAETSESIRSWWEDEGLDSRLVGARCLD